MTRDFALWCETAGVADRCEAVSLLVAALFDPAAGVAEIRHCTDAMLHLVADPSPKVRGAMAQRLAGEASAPRRLVRLLCEDVDTVAVPLVLASRVLSDEDLVDLAATGSVRLRCAIARRAPVSPALSAALLLSGERVVALELLANVHAVIAPSTLRDLADGPHGADGDLRDLLLRRHGLPAVIRQMLMLRTGETLASMPLARQVLGEAAARRVASEACEHGTSMVGEDLSSARMDEFVEHLRATGQITLAFLARTAAGGRIELFAAALANLSGLELRRVRAILVEARDPAFSALCAAARVPPDAVPVLLLAVRLWKNIAHGRIVPEGEAAAFVLDRLATIAGEGQVAAGEDMRRLLNRLAADAARRAARRTDAGRIAA